MTKQTQHTAGPWFIENEANARHSQNERILNLWLVFFNDCLLGSAQKAVEVLAEEKYNADQEPELVRVALINALNRIDALETEVLKLSSKAKGY